MDLRSHNLRMARGLRSPSLVIPPPRPLPSRPLPPVALQRRRRRSRRRDARRGVIATVVLVCVLTALLGAGFGVHSHVSAGRAALRASQMAAVAAELRVSPILFLPLDGDLCRRRWLDNATWMLADGGTVDCADAATANAGGTEAQQQPPRFEMLSAGFRWKGQN